MIDGQVGREPTMNDILEAAEQARNEWTDKKRITINGTNAQVYLQKFTSTLNGHQFFFELLPTQSQYCSIFYGAIKTLIKASINHVKIAEGLTKALAEISTDIALASAEAEIVNTSQMCATIGQYYSSVFLFLKDAMGWFQSKWYSKIRNAFNEHFYDDFTNQIAAIKDCSSQISRIMKIGNAAETRDIRLVLEDIRVGLEDRERQMAEAAYRQEQQRLQIERQAAELKELMSSEFKKLAGQEMMQLLKKMINSKDTEDDEKVVKSTRQITTRLTTIEDDLLSSPATFAKPRNLKDATYNIQNVLNWSSRLDDFIGPPRDLIDILNSSDCFAEISISNGLNHWTTSADCEMLWIEGLYETIYPSSTSTLAAAIVSAGHEVSAQMPIISYFCSDPENPSDDNRSLDLTSDDRAEALLIDLTYTIIRKLLHWLPARLKTTLDLSSEYFSLLDGTMDTWQESFKLLSGLLKLAPALCLIVIDGIEHLDNTTAEVELRQLLRLLQNTYLECLDFQLVEPKNEKNKIFKVLFTTAGSSEALNGLDLDSMETIRATPSKSRHAPLRMRAGRQRLTPF
ncbi:phytanoyl- dioxygenase family protein [Phlyctema vagabunda]|uniref:Phytanoyl- dioxygenase family protein n=1 Tax=Phlyctema vagabunda TaxID=108571 RepID=A0ABR4PUG9_9HELO